MSGDKAWKKFERDSAALFSGKRYWSNSGERVDFAGYINGLPVKGQCKLVKVLPFPALTRLAEEPGVDVVCVKLRRGSGKESQPLVVMTFDNYRRLHGQETAPR